ncbi:thioredoxin family protein [Ohessyouella blattaphilus]|uniref:Thioredoxin family protein n=1 Tax=Ohessyouella blattaphilus TaxID=2949333 RepID=A0ABT1EI99_9FIRM|nr:thioredoxin family protein [Ohessyouella blattaphilus]MCP1110425.1 thioredoxin family protein [Ohessyouella blattaphilus]MCR8563819.1 thioredoxin family protein [Ohessyouella blattaphilus]MDL2249997.1 thioredoxin family protein [Lachnospiraceae bacterium OttesenSCG-928-J05]
MVDNQTTKNEYKKQLWIRISVIVAIVAVIGIIFLIKNTAKKDTAALTDDGSQTTEHSDADETYPLKLTAVNIETIKAYGIPTVIDFGSDSCIPCKEMAPTLEKLNAEWQEKAAVQFIDVWKYTDGVSDFPVQVIPTQVFFNADGSPFIPSEDLQKEIQFDMYSDKESKDHVFTVHQGGLTEEQLRIIFAEMGVE